MGGQRGRIAALGGGAGGSGANVYLLPQPGFLLASRPGRADRPLRRIDRAAIAAGRGARQMLDELAVSEQAIEPGDLEALVERLAGVKERVRIAVERSGRDPASITLVAVSKTQS